MSLIATKSIKANILLDLEYKNKNKNKNMNMSLSMRVDPTSSIRVNKIR